MNATSEDAEVRDIFGLEPNTLRGPDGHRRRAPARGRRPRVRALSLWAAVPHYVAHPPSPKATLALLHRIEQLLGEPVPLGELPDDAAAWQHGVDELAAEDSRSASTCTSSRRPRTPRPPEASGEAIAQEFERYLRRRDKGTGG